MAVEFELIAFVEELFGNVEVPKESPLNPNILSTIMAIIARIINIAKIHKSLSVITCHLK